MIDLKTKFRPALAAALLGTASLLGACTAEPVTTTRTERTTTVVAPPVSTTTTTTRTQSNP